MTQAKYVHINQSQHAVPFDEKHSFFFDEVKQALAIIHEHVAALPDQPRSHQHDTIAVLGGRGLGKTSFLLSVLQQAQLDMGKDVCAIQQPIDPSLLENNEVFLATVTSAILRTVEDAVQADKKSRLYEREGEAMYQALDRLATSFSVLSPRDEHMWGDSNSDSIDIAERMLRNARSGSGLSDDFARFVHAATRVLGVKAFILAIDDVDTAFESGYLVLETLRKYLGTPHLLTILSGDLDLYQMLVLDHNYEQLETLIKAESRFVKDEGRDGLKPYRTQALNLRDQYIQKLLPPHRRIHLDRIRKHLSSAHGSPAMSITLEWDDARQTNAMREAALVQVLGYLARDLFAWPRPLPSNPAPEHALLNPARSPAMQLLPANTRVLMRLFKVLHRWHRAYGGSSLGAGLVPLDGLFQVFVHQLHAWNVKVEDLRKLASGGGLDWLAQHIFWQCTVVANAFYLRDNNRRDWPADESSSQVSLLLRAAFNRGCRTSQNLGMWIDYGLRIVSPALRIRQKDNEEQREQLVKALDYRLGLGSALPLVEVAGQLRASAWQWPDNRNAGCMWVPARRRRDNMHRSFTGFANISVDDREKTFGMARWWDARKSQSGEPIVERDVLLTMQSFWNRADHAGQILALFFMNVRNERDHNHQMIDMFQGLANLAELLGKATPVVDDGHDALSHVVQEFLLLRTNEDREYATSSDDKQNQNEFDDEDEFDDEEESDEYLYDTPDELRDALVFWCSATRGLTKDDWLPHSPPTYLPIPQTARIFERLDSQFASIKEELPLVAWSVGAMLERWATAFLQILLTTELDYRIDKGLASAGFNNAGIVKSTLNFESNLRVLQAHVEGATLSPSKKIKQWTPDEWRWYVPRNALLWMSCPVLLACCRPQLREHIKTTLAAIESVFAEHLNDPLWFRPLHRGIDACEKLFTECEYEKRTYDIHELWCGLFISPQDRTRPSDEDYQAFHEAYSWSQNIKKPAPRAKAKKSQS